MTGAFAGLHAPEDVLVLALLVPHAAASTAMPIAAARARPGKLQVRRSIALPLTFLQLIYGIDRINRVTEGHGGYGRAGGVSRQTGEKGGFLRRGRTEIMPSMDGHRIVWTM